MKKIKLITLKSEQWQMYKKLRLKSLLTDPIAFATTYVRAVVYSDEEWKQKLANPGSIFLFAEHDKQLIGMIGVYTKDNGQTNEVATIVGVYVDPEHRGKGIGRLLMEKALDETDAQSEIKRVKVWISETQISAIKLYKSFGFRLIRKKKQEIFFDGNYFDEFIMEKVLKLK